MTDYTYFDDFVAGQSYQTDEVTMTAEEIIAFAQKFDPQPMHTDPAAAEHITGGLIASGWHTASLTMGLLVTSRYYNPPPGALGMGFDNLKWLKPVRPGDTLKLQVELVSVRPSESRPGWGIITNRFTTLNQHGEPVQVMTSSAILPGRHKESG